MTDESSADHIDLNRACLLLRAMSHGVESVDADQVGELIAAQEHPDRLVRGLGAVINQLVEFVDDAYHLTASERQRDEDEPVQDHLHTFQPAIVVRLSRTANLDPAAVPLMAGVLTAASLGLDCYEWWLHVGSEREVDYPVWAFTAFYLCDLIGHVRGQPDYALDIIGSAVADSAGP